MKLPRISVAGLMAVVVAAALNASVGRALWAYDDELVPEAAVAGLALQGALFRAVRGRGRDRLFWAGFATAGVLALAVFTHLLFPYTSHHSNYWLRIERFADGVFHRLAMPCNLHGDTRIRPAVASAKTFVEQAAATEITPHLFLNFVAIYVALWSLPTLGVAVAGGLLALLIRRLWPRAGAAEGPCPGVGSPDPPPRADAGERRGVREERVVVAAILALVGFNVGQGLFLFAYGLTFPVLVAVRVGVVLVGVAVQGALLGAARSRGRARAFWAAFAAVAAVAELIHLRHMVEGDALFWGLWRALEDAFARLLDPDERLVDFAKLAVLAAGSAVPQLLLALAGGLLAAATSRGGRKLIAGLGGLVLLALLAVVFLPRQPLPQILPPPGTPLRP